MKRVILSIRGLHCTECVSHVERSLQATSGVRDVDVDLMSRSACVEHDERECGVNDLISAVSQVGLQVDGFTVP